MDIYNYFNDLRYDDNHHLGLGDIRLTIAQQQEVIAHVEALSRHVAELEAELARVKGAVDFIHDQLSEGPPDFAATKWLIDELQRRAGGE